MRLIMIITLVTVFQSLYAQKVFPNHRTAIINCNIVDVVNHTIIHNGVVLTENGKITYVGGQRDIPHGFDTLDIEGNYLLPGMIDVHTHLKSLASAERAMMSGVTTVRSASVPAYQDVTLHKLVMNGHLPGPDMVPCGVYVTPHIGETALADPRFGPLMDGVTTEEDLRTIVRINIDRGAQVIKTRGTERAGLPTTDPREQTYTTDQLRVVVEEAAKYNVPVMIHGHGDEGSYAAVEAGALSIEHGTFLSDKTLELMKEKGAYLVPTYVTIKDLVEPGGDYEGPVLNMRGQYMLPKSERTIKKAIELGVKIATGADNDYAAVSTSRVSQEVEEFIRLGMPVWQAIETTTTTAAELIGLGAVTGQITVGYEADLIAISDNPLEDFKALQDVLMVMSNGNVTLMRLPFGK